MNYKCVKFHMSISKVPPMRVDQSQILKNSEKNGLEPRTSQLDRVINTIFRVSWYIFQLHSSRKAWYADWLSHTNSVESSSEYFDFVLK